MWVWMLAEVGSGWRGLQKFVNDITPVGESRWFIVCMKAAMQSSIAQAAEPTFAEARRSGTETSASWATRFNSSSRSSRICTGLSCCSGSSMNSRTHTGFRLEHDELRDVESLEYESPHFVKCALVLSALPVIGRRFRS